MPAFLISLSSYPSAIEHRFVGRQLERRTELEAKMDAARTELARIVAPKQAKGDAAALAGYFASLGLNVETDAVNRLLVLLAVLVIEFGGGLALAVGRTRRSRLCSARTQETPAE